MTELRCVGAAQYPATQSPLVTLLHKRRDDSTRSRGAVYMLGVMSFEEAKLEKSHTQQQQQPGRHQVFPDGNDSLVSSCHHGTDNHQTANTEAGTANTLTSPANTLTSTANTLTSTANTLTSTANTLTSTASTLTCPANAQSCTSSVTETTCQLGQCIAYSHTKTPVSWNAKLTWTADSDSANSDRQSKQHQLRPLRIEDYEPGQCSLADHSTAESKFYNPPVDKPAEHCKYVLSSIQRQIHKLGPMSVAQSDLSMHELYQLIQRGGPIPPHGLQMPTDSKKGNSWPSALRCPNHSQLTDDIYGNSASYSYYGNSSPRTRQERDLENTVRQMRLERVVAEQKLKCLARQHRDNIARRHSDIYTPMQRFPSMFNRYEDETSPPSVGCHTRPKPSFGLKNLSTVCGKARAVYTFRAQSNRELSFRKGDYIYLLRHVDKNWFLGERHGLVGMFPCSYVEVLVSLEEAQSVACEHEGLGRVLYDFTAHSAMELSLRKGDLVKLIRLVDVNWYEARTGESRGIVPVSYVETIVEPTTGTPMTTRTATPMPPAGALSPMGSTIAPTIPSAPMSPTDSEYFDESIYGSREFKDYYGNSCTSTPLPPCQNLQHTSDLEYQLHQVDGTSISGRQQAGGHHGSKYINTGDRRFIGMKAGLELRSQLDSIDSRQTSNEKLRMFCATRRSPSSTSHSELRYPPYRVLFSYEPHNSDELELVTGDVVFVVERCEDGWFVGTNQRTQDFGTFPGNFVERIDYDITG